MVSLTGGGCLRIEVTLEVAEVCRITSASLGSNKWRTKNNLVIDYRFEEIHILL